MTSAPPASGCWQQTHHSPRHPDALACALQHADVNFKLTPSKQTASGLGSAGYTPSKLLLTHAERRMNMLTPTQASKVANADLETGKVGPPERPASE